MRVEPSLNEISVLIKETLEPWLGSSAGWSIVLIHQRYRFDPWSGYIQELTNACMEKWNNKSVFLSLCLKSINKMSRILERERS